MRETSHTYEWLFVVDTNVTMRFNSELCAFITGHVGSEYNGIVENFKWDRKIDGVYEYYIFDDYATRPYKCYIDTNGYPYSVAIGFTRRPTPEEIELMKERAYLFPDAYWTFMESRGYHYINDYGKIKIEGFRVIEVVKTYKEEDV